MRHERTHPVYQDGCYPCKLLTVSFGAVPGGTRPGGRAKQFIRQREKGLNEYAKRRKAGEQPDGTTLEKIAAYDKRVDTFEKLEKNLREDNPKPVVDQLKKSTFNARNTA